MNRTWFMAAAIALITTGCASSPAMRTGYVGLPQLESGWSRMYVSSGIMSGVKLWSVHQVGPTFINNQRVGASAKDEDIAVDLLPGTYEAYCTPEQPEKNFIEKRQFTFKAGETRYFACDMDTKGLGMAFGLAGALFSDYLTRTYLEERPMGNPNSKLVSYFKFNGSSNANSPTLPESVVTHLNADNPSASTPINDSVSQKLRELQNLRKDGIITEDEFQKKKQQLLEKF